MFTGIISDCGEVREVTTSAQGRRMTIRSAYPPETITLGASIAHDGCCLTITDTGTDPDGHWHSVDVSSHTLAHTTLGSWQPGRWVNLERALKAGDELGGHLVSGHVDGLARITAIEREEGGDAVHYTMTAPPDLAPYLADKGSVTLDGVSLTVTWVGKIGRENHETPAHAFGLTLIPHTLAVTSWGEKQVGDLLNLEIDLLARYARRILAWDHGQTASG